MGIVVKNTDGLEEIKPRQAIIPHDQSLIKYWNINYSIPQKIRLGLLPISALDEYYAQKEEEANPKSSSSETTVEPVVSESKEEAPVRKNHTFWEDDEGDREQLSQEDYDKFLAENNIQLTQADDLVAQLLASQNS